MLKIFSRTQLHFIDNCIFCQQPLILCKFSIYSAHVPTILQFSLISSCACPHLFSSLHLLYVHRCVCFARPYTTKKKLNFATKFLISPPLLKPAPPACAQMCLLCKATYSPLLLLFPFPFQMHNISLTSKYAYLLLMISTSI